MPASNFRSAYLDIEEAVELKKTSNFLPSERRMHSTEEVDLRTLSAAQSGIWFTQVLDPDSPAFNIAEYVEIFGLIDAARFERALRRAVAKTGALHTRIAVIEGEPRLDPADDVGLELPVIDVSSAHDPEAAALAWMRHDRSEVFDLSRGPVFRHALLRLSAGRFFWYACNHHLCMDGYSGALVAREVAAIYSGAEGERVSGPQVSQPEARYLALLDEEHSYRGSAQFSRDQSYWKEQLAELPEAVTLSGKTPGRPGDFLACTAGIPRVLADELRAAGRSPSAGFSQIVCAASALYLHRFTGSVDFAL